MSLKRPLFHHPPRNLHRGFLGPIFVFRLSEYPAISREDVRPFIRVSAETNYGDPGVIQTLCNSFVQLTMTVDFVMRAVDVHYHLLVRIREVGPRSELLEKRLRAVR